MAYIINDECINCGSCESECPVSAISEGDGKYVIDEGTCIDCGACAGVLPGIRAAAAVIATPYTKYEGDSCAAGNPLNRRVRAQGRAALTETEKSVYVRRRRDTRSACARLRADTGPQPLPRRYGRRPARRFLPSDKDARAADLGAGTGAVSLLLLAREKAARVDAVELQPRLCDMMRRSAQLNGLSGRMSVYEADLRRLAGTLEAGAYGCVVSQPALPRGGHRQGKAPTRPAASPCLKPSAPSRKCSRPACACCAAAGGCTCATGPAACATLRRPRGSTAGSSSASICAPVCGQASVPAAGRALQGRQARPRMRAAAHPLRGKGRADGAAAPHLRLVSRAFSRRG